MKIIKVGAMWCPACIITNKYWKELKQKYNKIDFNDLDIDMDEDEVKPLNIGNTLPVVIIFDDNSKEVKRIIGEKNKDEMDLEIGEVYNEKKN